MAALETHRRHQMNDKPISFIYRDAKGNITFRQVFNISESDDYLQAICLIAGGLRTFRKDRILEKIDDIGSVDQRLQFYKDFFDTRPLSASTSHDNWKRNVTGAFEICFTGFKAQDKNNLTKIAESNGMIVRSNVTTQLSILCCGYNAGPAKVERARHQGVMVLSESQFHSLIETGEIPVDQSTTS